MRKPNLQFEDLSIEFLQAGDFAAVHSLEAEAGLSSFRVTEWEQRLQRSGTILLGVFRQSDNKNHHRRLLIGAFSGSVTVNELEIDNLVVTVSQRNQGIAHLLLAEALRRAWEKGAQCAFLEVRESNLPALNLYSSFGFTRVGKRQRYYHHPTEDALILKLEYDKFLTFLFPRPA